jgi:hypothetical protein
MSAVRRIPVVGLVCAAIAAAAVRGIRGTGGGDVPLRRGGVRDASAIPWCPAAGETGGGAPLTAGRPPATGAVRVRGAAAPDCTLCLVDKAAATGGTRTLTPDYTGDGVLEFYGVAAGDYVGAIVSGDRSTAAFPVRVAPSRISSIDAPSAADRPMSVLALSRDGEPVQGPATIWAVHPEFSIVHRWAGEPIALRGPLTDIEHATLRFPAQRGGRDAAYGGRATVERNERAVVLDVRSGPCRVELRRCGDGVATRDSAYVVGVRGGTRSVSLCAAAAAAFDLSAPIHTMARGSVESDGDSLAVSRMLPGAYMVGVGADERGDTILWRPCRVDEDGPTILGLAAPQPLAAPVASGGDEEVTLPALLDGRFGLSSDDASALDPDEVRAGRLREHLHRDGIDVVRIVGYAASGESRAAPARCRLGVLRFPASGLPDPAPRGEWTVRVTRALCAAEAEVVYEARGAGAPALLEGIPGSIDGDLEAVLDGGAGTRFVLEGAVDQGSLRAASAWRADRAGAAATGRAASLVVPVKARVRFVSHEGSPVAGAAVSCSETGSAGVTDPSGYARIDVADQRARTFSVRRMDGSWAKRAVADGDVVRVDGASDPPAAVPGGTVLAALGLGPEGLDAVALHVVALPSGDDGHAKSGSALALPLDAEGPFEVHIDAPGVTGFGWVSDFARETTRPPDVKLLLRAADRPAVFAVVLRRAVVFVQLARYQSRSMTLDAAAFLGLGRVTFEDGGGARAVTGFQRIEVRPGDSLAAVARE